MMAEMTDRPVWFPGNAAPPHLDGTLPGDFGCAVSPLRHWSPGAWTQGAHTQTSIPPLNTMGVTCRFDPLSLGSDPQILKW